MKVMEREQGIVAHRQAQGRVVQISPHLCILSMPGLGINGPSLRVHMLKERMELHIRLHERSMAKRSIQSESRVDFAD